MSKEQSKKFNTGVVLGKFMPPHHGHRLVITTALDQCEKVFLVVCRQDTDPIPADVRVEWLRILYPTADVRLLEVTFQVTEDQAWADGTVRILGQKPNAIFSSEEYGQRLAKLLSCDHVMVDQDRTVVPISASQIRQDPKKYSAYVALEIFRYLTNTP